MLQIQKSVTLAIEHGPRSVYLLFSISNACQKENEDCIPKAFGHPTYVYENETATTEGDATDNARLSIWL